MALHNLCRAEQSLDIREIIISFFFYSKIGVYFLPEAKFGNTVRKLCFS